MNQIIEDCHDVKILRFNQSKIPRIDVKSGKAMNLITEIKLVIVLLVLVIFMNPYYIQTFIQN